MKEMGFVGVGEAIVGRIFVLRGRRGMFVEMKRNFERSWPHSLTCEKNFNFCYKPEIRYVLLMENF